MYSTGKNIVYIFNFDQIALFLAMFVKLDLIPDSTALQDLLEFAVEVSKNYLENPYHSFHHAIDVTYITYYLFQEMGIAEHLDLNRADKAVLLISALGHDVLHPGTNNIFQVGCVNQIATEMPVAKKYHNKSVLENQSADFIKELLLKHTFLEQLNLGNCIPELKQKDNLIARISECILKTDMIHHFTLLEQVIEVADYNHEIGNTKTPIDTSPVKSNNNLTSVTAPTSISTNSSTTTPSGPATPKSLVDLIKLHNSGTLFKSCNSMASIDIPLKKIVFPKIEYKEYLMHNILHAAGTPS